jgi:hypothetical protein
MKLASFVTFASLAVCAFAQSINIGYPFPNKQIKPGQHLTVQVNRPVSIQPNSTMLRSALKNNAQDTLTGSQEVAIVISLLECPQNSTCPDPSDELGSTLYSGPYNPQFPTFSTPNDEPQQNFTVIVPSDFVPNRTAQLAVTHLSLVGVSGSPFLSFAFPWCGTLTTESPQAGPFGLYQIVNLTLNVVSDS